MIYIQSTQGLPILATYSATSKIRITASAVNQDLGSSFSKNIVEQKDPRFVYAIARAVTADVPNKNWDFFPLEEIQRAYPSFIGRNIFLDHNTKSVRNAVGKIIAAELKEDDEGHTYVACLFKVDRQIHPDIAMKIEDGIIDSVSMGANVKEAECLPPQTKIFTQDGLVQIKDVEVGDYVLTHKGRFRKVTRTFKNKRPDKLVKVVYSDGSDEKTMHCSRDRQYGNRVTMTLNHPVLLESGEWIPAEYLEPGDKVMCLVKRCLHCGKPLLYNYKYKNFCSKSCKSKYVHDNQPEILQHAVQKAKASWAEASEEERNNRARVNSEAQKRYWNSLTEEEKKEKIYKSTQGLRNFFNTPSEALSNELNRRVAYGKELFSDPARVNEAREKIKALYARFAKEKRSNLEIAFEEELKNRGYNDFESNKFIYLDGIRMYPDFVFEEKKIIVEIDGEYWHNKPQIKARDQKKTKMLEFYGYTVLRFTGTQIQKDLSRCVDVFERVYKNHSGEYTFAAMEVLSVNIYNTTPKTNSVYNISVEEDESYIAENLVVHNCSHCHHRAHAESEFCEHLNALGQYTDPYTGEQNYSINHGVEFTELSLVSVPADPTAKMHKVFNLQNGITKNAIKEEDVDTSAAPIIDEPSDKDTTKDQKSNISPENTGAVLEVKQNPLEFFQFDCASTEAADLIYNLLEAYKNKGIEDLMITGKSVKVQFSSNIEDPYSFVNDAISVFGLELRHGMLPQEKQAALSFFLNKIASDGGQTEVLEFSSPVFGDIALQATTSSKSTKKGNSYYIYIYFKNKDINTNAFFDVLDYSIADGYVTPIRKSTKGKMLDGYSDRVSVSYRLRDGESIKENRNILLNRIKNSILEATHENIEEIQKEIQQQKDALLQKENESKLVDKLSKEFYKAIDSGADSKDTALRIALSYGKDAKHVLDLLKNKVDSLDLCGISELSEKDIDEVNNKTENEASNTSDISVSPETKDEVENKIDEAVEEKGTETDPKENAIKALKEFFEKRDIVDYSHRTKINKELLKLIKNMADMGVTAEELGFGPKTALFKRMVDYYLNNQGDETVNEPITETKDAEAVEDKDNNKTETENKEVPEKEEDKNRVTKEDSIYNDAKEFLDKNGYTKENLKEYFIQNKDKKDIANVLYSIFKEHEAEFNNAQENEYEKYVPAYERRKNKEEKASIVDRYVDELNENGKISENTSLAKIINSIVKQNPGKEISKKDLKDQLSNFSYIGGIGIAAAVLSRYYTLTNNEGNESVPSNKEENNETPTTEEKKNDPKIVENIDDKKEEIKEEDEPVDLGSWEPSNIGNTKSSFNFGHYTFTPLNVIDNNYVQEVETDKNKKKDNSPITKKVYSPVTFSRMMKEIKSLNTFDKFTDEKSEGGKNFTLRLLMERSDGGTDGPYTVSIKKNGSFSYTFSIAAEEKADNKVNTSGTADSFTSCFEKILSIVNETLNDTGKKVLPNWLKVKTEEMSDEDKKEFFNPTSLDIPDLTGSVYLEASDGKIYSLATFSISCNAEEVEGKAKKDNLQETEKEVTYIKPVSYTFNLVPSSNKLSGVSYSEDIPANAIGSFIKGEEGLNRLIYSWYRDAAQKLLSK